MNEINWIIEGLRVLPAGPDGLQNVVLAIGWRAEIRTEAGQIAGSFGSVEVPAPNPELFTPFDQLTPDQVVSWVKELIGAKEISSIETRLRDNLQRLSEPVPIVVPPPWAN